MENASLKQVLYRMLELQEEMVMHLKNLGLEVGQPTRTDRGALMTRQQVKDYLAIGESTYKRKVDEGILKPIKMPGGDRFYQHDLDDALKESKRRGRV